MAEMMLPVNYSVERLAASVPNAPDHPVPDLPQPSDIPDPKDLAIWEQESYELTADLAASLGFSIASVNSDSQARVMVFGIARYKDVQSGSHTYRYGVSIRVVLKIRSTDDKVQVSLPAIAANVELNGLEANSQMLVSGYVGDISDLLPSWQSFDVKTYAAYVNSINQLQKKIFSDLPNVRSTLLSSTLAASIVPEVPARKHGGHFHW